MGMKKRFLLLLLTLETLLCWNAAFAEYQDGYTYYIADNKAYIQAYDSAPAILNIPETLGGQPVVSIEKQVFAGKTSITEVTMPDTVTFIGESCFSGCEGLTSISLSPNVGELLRWSFMNCYNLTSITIPEQCKTVKSEAFNGCKSLTDVTFGKGLTLIDPNGFMNCTALVTVDMSPSAITEIGAQAFKGCTSLSEVCLSEPLMKVGSDAFKGCPLTRIELQDKLTLIEYDGFPGLDNKDVPITWKLYCHKDSHTAEFISLNRTDEALGWRTHDFCDYEIGGDFLLRWENDPDLGKVICVSGYDGADPKAVIPEGMQKICANAFQDNTSVMEVSFPEGLLRIDDAAFYGSGIEEVQLPESLVILGKHSFSNCPSLTRAVFPDAFTKIDDYTFTECVSLKSVVANGVTDIGAHAFQNCLSLSTLPIHDGVSKIGDEAFAGCAALRAVALPASLVSNNAPLGINVFKDCTALTDVKLPGTATFTALPAGTFSGCTAMTDIDLTGIYWFGENVFFGCSSLISLTIEAGVHELYAGFAQYCGGLRYIQFNGSGESDLLLIEDNAFTTDKSYKYVVICKKDSYAWKWAKKHGKTRLNIDTADYVISCPPSWTSPCAFVGDEIECADEFHVFPEKKDETYTISCTSSDPLVAKISQGNIVCQNPGTTTIEATVTKGNKSKKASYKLTVYNHTLNFSIPDTIFCKGWNPGSRPVTVNEVIPADGYDPSFTFKIKVGEYSYQETGTEFNIPQKDYGDHFLVPGMGTLTVTSRDGITKTADVLVFHHTVSVNPTAYQADVELGEEFIVTADVELALGVDGKDIQKFQSKDYLYKVMIPDISKSYFETVEGNKLRAIGLTSSLGAPIQLRDVYNYDTQPRSCNYYVIPAGVATLDLPSNIKKIEDHAFEGTKLKRIRLYDGCRQIGSRAFANAKELERIYIPNTVTYIADDAFEGCDKEKLLLYCQCGTVKDGWQAVSYAQQYAEGKFNYRVY